MDEGRAVVVAAVEDIIGGAGGYARWWLWCYRYSLGGFRSKVSMGHRLGWCASLGFAFQVCLGL